MRISDWSSDVCSSDLERLRGVVAVEREVDAVAGGAAQRVGIDPSRGVTCTLRIVDEGLGPAGPPHAGRGNDGALQGGVAGQRHAGRGEGALRGELGRASGREEVVRRGEYSVGAR